MTKDELREAIHKAATTYDGHVTNGSLEEIMKVVEGHFSVPRCPRCGSPKLSGICGHTWEIGKPNEG